MFESAQESRLWKVEEKKHSQGRGNQVEWICWVQIWGGLKRPGEELGQQEPLMVLEKGRSRSKVIV